MKIVAVAVAIVAVYQLVIPRLVPNGGKGHDQWQENLIKAQRLIYHHVAPTTVVVGSSELARLVLPPEFYNLALSGSTSLTGLEIVARSGVHPKRVVVEISDAITHAPNTDFLDSLFGPVNDHLRRTVTVLQDAYQPGVLVNHVAQAWAEKHAIVADDRVAPELYAKLVVAAVASHHLPADFLTLQWVTVTLRERVDTLHAAGVEVVFVEPPEAPEVWASPYSSSIRASIHAAFGDVRWIPSPDPVHYHTTDGVHLDRASAAAFAAVISNQL